MWVGCGEWELIWWMIMVELYWIDVKGFNGDLKVLIWGLVGVLVVLCLYGFLDIVYGWCKVVFWLVEFGWYVVVLFMCGYVLFLILVDGSYYVGVLMYDVLWVCLVVGGIECDVIIGYDWGVIVVIGLVVMFDSLFVKVVIMLVLLLVVFCLLGWVFECGWLLCELLY